MKNKISSKSLYTIILKNGIVIIVLTAIFGIIGYFYAQHKQSTVYEVTQNVIINRSYKGNSASEELQADLSLGKTYEKVIEGNNVSRQARLYLPKKLKKRYSAADINSMTNVSSVQGTTMLKISVTSSSANLSAEIANAVTKAAIKQIPDEIPSGSIKAVSKADQRDANSITSPSRKKYIKIGMSVGFLLGLVIAFSITTWKNLL